MGREPWFTDADCVILCVDADTGKTLWKRVYVEEAFNLEAGFNKGGCQLTPCVAEGRAYAIGTCGRLHCVDARTGLPLWSGDLGIRARYQDDTKDGQREVAQVWGGRNDFGGCPMVAGGVAAVSDHWEYKGGPRTMGKGNGLVGFEAATGRRLWYVPGAGGRGMLGSTPLRWVHKGREYFIAAGEAGVTCIEPATGRVLWSLPDAGFDNAAAVDENRLWCQTGGLTCYRIEPSGARKEWTVAADPGFSSPALYRDHLYMLSKDGLLCLEAATGKTVAKVAQDHVVGSLAVADGRLFVQATGRGKFGMNVFKADPADLKPLGGQWRIPFANSTSPAVAGGRLYVRGRDRLHALDLRVR
jgi:outer membrane protein assembly factor BamB